MRRAQVVLSALLATLVLSAATCAPDANVTSHFKLFDPPRPGGVFAYAPASITDGINDYHFYCGNVGNGEIKDYIYLRHLQRQSNGSYALIRDQAVLAGTAGAWDSRHVCDPAVTAGSFKLDGTSFAYAMFYTGTIDPDSNGTQNSVGVAFSNDLVNWTKRSSPVVPKLDTETWGRGQPWTTSVTGGRVLLGYTRSNPVVMEVTQIDLANTTSTGGITTVTPVWNPPTGGLNASGAAALQGADFAYDAGRDRFWTVREGHYDSQPPTFISNQVELAWISGSNFWNGTGSWQSLGAIDITTTGNYKNHNSGIQRTPYGNIASNQIRVNFASSDNIAAWPDALFDYRIYSAFIPT